MRTIIVSAVIAFLAACSSQPPVPAYQLTGQILVVKPETSELLVKHEDIKGFMPAMTMPYTVKDAALLKDKTAGDLITATLNVAPGGPFLSAIVKTGAAPLPEDARPDIPPAANVHLLKAGDLVPATALVDQGQSITMADFKGSALAVTFIYTRCPLANFCPLLDRRFAEVQKMAAADPALAGKIRLLSISFDPANDRDAALKAHARKLGADPNVWRFATAEQAVVDRLAAEFAVNVIREKDGTITHNLRTAIVDPSGRIVSILDNNSWEASELVSGLKHALATR
ncbi:MAG: SCO family protein [Acidimicrobiia bacterium]